MTQRPPSAVYHLDRSLVNLLIMTLGNPEYKFEACLAEMGLSRGALRKILEYPPAICRMQSSALSTLCDLLFHMHHL